MADTPEDEEAFRNSNGELSVLATGLRDRECIRLCVKEMGEMDWPRSDEACALVSRMAFASSSS